jgi:hypothetical protein
MSEPLAILIPLSAPEGESEHEFWHRKFTEALGAICIMREENDKLQAETDKLRWMLDAFMHHHRRYMEIRGGYADVFALVKQDLADDYDEMKEEAEEDDRAKGQDLAQKRR